MLHHNSQSLAHGNFFWHGPWCTMCNRSNFKAQSLDTAIKRRILFLAGAGVICAYFFWGAGGGLWAYFTHDDLMNLYYYWSRPVLSLLEAILLYFSPYFRPMGGVFYRSVFALVGFHPLPFRLVCFALLLGNLYLLFRFARALTGSAEVSALATLLAAYHPGFFELYYNSGGVYDILCFFFYFLGFLYYVKIRQDGRHPSPPQLLILLILYVCALNSKEMAIIFPLLIGIYELLYHPPDSLELKSLWPWALHQGRAGAIAIAITLPFLWGKLSSQSAFYRHPLYAPHLTPRQYLQNVGGYMDHLLLHFEWFTPAKTLVFLILLFAVAWTIKSRPLKFCWFFIVLSILPVALITPRSAFVLYIPMAGWAIYIAILLVRLRDLLIHKLRIFFSRPTPAGTAPLSMGFNFPVQPKQVLLFLLMLILLVRAYRAERQVLHPWTIGYQQTFRSMTAQLSQVQPTMPRGARILFLEDPIPDAEWDMLFWLSLYYGDRTLTVDQVRRMPQKPDASALARYDYVFTWEDGRLIEIHPRKNGMKPIQ